MKFYDPPNSSRLPSIEKAVCLLGLLSLVFSFYAISVGFANSIFDFHSFRQTQTAISAASIMQGGKFLRYETPVVGPPWSVPFEFPLYQGTVAHLAKIFSTPLDQTGRFVSIAFYYLCFFPLASILSNVGLRGTGMIPSLALFAMSPIYIFVSRLFMIESTALFLSLLYADQMFRLVLGARPWQYRHIAGGAIFGVLAGLVKVTTLAPFFALGTCLAGWGLWKERKIQASVKREAAIGAFCVALPVAATWQWTRFADQVKAQNPIGVYLTSKALSSWNFGTLRERLHPRIYLQLWLAASNHLGSIAVAMVVLLAYVWLCRRWNWIAVTCVALYIGTILIFFNLHVVHEYYSYSIAVFLVVALGALLASVLRVHGRWAWMGVGLLALQLAACGFRYFAHYYPIQSWNAPGRPQAAALIDKTTTPEDVILIVGLDWSSELPYQSHRRAIMDATFGHNSDSWTTGPIGHALDNEGSQNVTALVACDKGRYGNRLAILLRDVGMSHATDLHVDDCDIYERGPRIGVPQRP